MQKKAIVLFSGGLDSTTCLAITASEKFDCYALSFAYGQRHSIELEAAKNIAQHFGVIEHKILSIPLNEIKGSSLTDSTLTIPDYQPTTGIPNTYVPARNTIFLSFALAWAEVVGARDIYIGANEVDYSGYPDCRPEYLRSFETMANLATKEEHHYTIHAPLLRLNKAGIIRKGIALGIDYSQTISCYRANDRGQGCGNCDSCTYRKKGFIEAAVPDPTRYI